MILRTNGRTTLVLASVSTSGVILSTTRQTSEADCRIVIAEDGVVGEVTSAALRACRHSRPLHDPARVC